MRLCFNHIVLYTPEGTTSQQGPFQKFRADNIYESSEQLKHWLEIFKMAKFQHTP